MAQAGQTKKPSIVGSFLSTMVAALSLLYLMQYASLYGPGPFIDQVLSGYRHVVDAAIEPFQPIIEKLLQNLAIWLPWFPKLDLLPHWRYIFVPLWLFITRDGIICWQRNHVLGAVNFLVGATIFAVASVAAGTERLDDPLKWVAFWPIAGFTHFNVFTAGLDSTFRRPANQTWLETFKFYVVRFPLPSALAGCALLYVGARYEIDSIAILLMFIVAMAVRNIVVSTFVAVNILQKDVEKARNDPTHSPKSWWEHFMSLQTRRLGWVLLKAVGYALIIIAIDKREELSQAVTAVAGPNAMLVLFGVAFIVAVVTTMYQWWRRAHAT